MLKYAKKTGEHTYDVGLGTSKASEDFYKNLGMVQTNVERGTDGNWYDVGFAPKEKPIEEKLAALDASYTAQKQDLANEYTDALIHGDTDAQELVQQEMSNLDEWYDEEYRKIEEGE